jgi:prephenate dehydratase
MEDSSSNTTIFITIAKEPHDIAPDQKHILTSLLFTARNIPAALYKALGGFATNQVNLLKLESYIPSGNSDNAQFFVTLEGNPQQRNVQRALEELGFFCKNVKVLGVYPAHEARFSG